MPDMYNGDMHDFAEQIAEIKASILKYVPAKCIYLFGSHAYGKSAEQSDIRNFNPVMNLRDGENQHPFA
jgi:predicted nucleotidyltransferase